MRGTVTYESAAVELDRTHRMIHESCPQGVPADYFLLLHISWRGHVGSKLVSVVAGYYTLNWKPRLAMITFFGVVKEKMVFIDEHSHQALQTIKHPTTTRFCLRANFAMQK